MHPKPTGSHHAHHSTGVTPAVVTPNPSHCMAQHSTSHQPCSPSQPSCSQRVHTPTTVTPHHAAEQPGVTLWLLLLLLRVPGRSRGVPSSRGVPLLLLWGVCVGSGVASGSRGVPGRRGVCPWCTLVWLLLLLWGVALWRVAPGSRGWVCPRLLLLLGIAWVRLLVLLLLVGLCIGGILWEATSLLTLQHCKQAHNISNRTALLKTHMHNPSRQHVSSLVTLNMSQQLCQQAP